MDFDLLRNRPVCDTRLCAEWLISEWGHFDTSVTVDDKVLELSSVDGPSELPLNFIGAVGSDVMGMGRILKTDLDCMKSLSPWLGDLYVRPDLRGRGVGSQLVKHAERLARELGYTKLYLFVSNQQNFYYGLGWRLHSEVDEKGSLVKVLEKSLVGDE